MEERVPPQELEAEQAVLGAMLLDRAAIDAVRAVLLPADFYRREHRLIFEAAAALADAEEQVDVLTLASELERRGQLEGVGGRAYIVVLIDALPFASRAEAYARRVREAAVRRRLIHVGAEIAARAYSREEALPELLDSVQRLVLEVGARTQQRDYRPLGQLLWSVLETALHEPEPGESTGVLTGFSSLDELTAGLQPSDLILIAGRPSSGKSALAVQLALRAAENGHTVSFHSLEMSANSLGQRILSAAAEIDGILLRRRTISSEQSAILNHQAGRMGNFPLYVDEDPGATALEIRARCRQLQAQHGLGLVVVDYVQRVASHGRSENRNQEVALIARSLKSLARELEVPVIALSQLNREVERREGKRPTLADLRESGDLEAEADLVGLLYNPEFYQRGRQKDGEPEPDRNAVEKAELIIAKHRNGATQTVKLGFRPRFAVFCDTTDRDATDAPPARVFAPAAEVDDPFTAAPAARYWED